MGPHAGTLKPLLPALRTAVPPQADDFVFWRNPTHDGAPLPAVVPPFLLIALQPDPMVAFQVLPEAVERHRVCWWVCAPEAVRAEPDFEAKLAASQQLLDAIHREDMTTCAAVQRGLASRLATPGALSPLEGTLAHFQRWWLARMR